MKTLVLSNATTPHNPLARSTSSLRTSSANVETAKKAKVVDDHVEATPTTTTADVEDQSCHQDPHPGNNISGSKEEQHLHVADEEECAPGATKSPCSKVESTKTIPVKEEPLATPAAASSPLVPVVCENTEKLQKKATKKKSKDQKVAAAAAAAGPQELSRVSQDERECYRHAIVDVPALVELLTLVGRCPVCKSPLRTDKLKTDEDTAVVHVSLKCSRSRCQFVKHWCSSPTAGISGVTTDSTDK